MSSGIERKSSANITRRGDSRIARKENMFVLSACFYRGNHWSSVGFAGNCADAQCAPLPIFQSFPQGIPQFSTLNSQLSILNSQLARQCDKSEFYRVLPSMWPERMMGGFGSVTSNTGTSFFSSFINIPLLLQNPIYCSVTNYHRTLPPSDEGGGKNL